MLTIGGNHVPEIPLFELVGSIGAVCPRQIVEGKLKVGVPPGVIKIVTTSITDAPHAFRAFKVTAKIPEAVVGIVRVVDNVVVELNVPCEDDHCKLV